MVRPRVKICCIQSVAEAEIAVAAGAALLGLVGAMPSGPGPIGDDAIAEIAGWAPPGVATVLLSSETTAEGLIAHAARCRPTALQIVDAPEAGARAALRRALPGLKIIQVVHVEGPSAVAEARAAEDADAILLDSGRPSAPVRELGGTGRVHDWDIAASVVRAVARPVFLAGGLGPGNAAAAVRRVGPYGLDLCSGVRTGDRLDPAKLAAFFDAVAAA